MVWAVRGGEVHGQTLLRYQSLGGGKILPRGPHLSPISGGIGCAERLVKDSGIKGGRGFGVAAHSYGGFSCAKALLGRADASSTPPRGLGV